MLELQDFWSDLGARLPWSERQIACLLAQTQLSAKAHC